MRDDRDDVAIAFSDGRPPLRRRDMVRDNPETMRREFLSPAGAVRSWVSAAAVEELRKWDSTVRPWGWWA